MQNNQMSQGELARHEGAGGTHAAHGVYVQDVLGRRRGQLEAFLPQKTPFSPQTALVAASLAAHQDVGSSEL